MIDKKINSGYGHLKVKFEKLQEENKQLKIEVAEQTGIVEKQASHISELSASINDYKGKIIELYSIQKSMYNHMGWFRRLLWDVKRN